MTEPVDEYADDNEDDWREGLLLRIRFLLIVIFAFAVFTTFVATRSAEMRLLSAFIVFATLVLIAVLYVPRIPLHWRAAMTTTAVGVTAFFAYFVGGFLAGAAVSIAYTLVLATLLFGRRTFILLMVVFGSLPVIAVVLLNAGVWQGPSLADYDPAEPINWIRTGIISIVIWFAIGMSVLYVKGTLERNLERRQRALAQKDEALEQLRTEIHDRRAAEKARQDAEQVAAQAQKLEAIGRLAAGVAHDFNNALLVIRSWNELRSEPDFEIDEKEANDAIEQAVEHGAYLARQLLAFGRKDVRAPKHIELDGLVEGTARTLRRLLPANISLRVDTDSNLAVFADEAQLQQVFINLAINSRDAILDGGEICIRTRRSNRPGRQTVDDGPSDDRPWIAIEIEDNGVGMDEQTREVAFEPFFTTKDASQGSGLGLSIVFGIVRQSGGHIEIDSEPTRGTIVSIYLPASDDTGGESVAAPTSELTGDLSARVLVVEDDPLALKLIVRVLEQNGLSVIACKDGDDAMSTLAEDNQPYGVLCCDAIFPGTPLSRIVEVFRTHSPAAPILVCSGYVREKIAISGVESGAWEYLAKPFSNKDLIGKIRMLLADDRA